MTIRSILNTKKCRFVLIGICGMVVAVIGMTLIQLHAAFAVAGAVGFLGFLIAIIGGLLFGITCPRCNTAWHHLSNSWSPFAIDPRIRYCPFCGHDVDTELQEEWEREHEDFDETARSASKGVY